MCVEGLDMHMSADVLGGGAEGVKPNLGLLQDQYVFNG